MNEKSQRLITLFEEFLPTDGMLQTTVSSLVLYRSSSQKILPCSLYKPSVCFILSGAKEVFLENEQYYYDSNSFLVTSVHLPLESCITKASQEEPYFGLKMQFDISDVIRATQEIQKQQGELFEMTSSCDRGVYVGSLDDGLKEALTRLLSLLKTPKEVPLLSPLLVQEILFRVIVQNPHHFIKQFAQIGSCSNRMFNVIQEINNQFCEPLEIEKLAKKAGMSLSLFYRNFKKITHMSPIQYQKKLRLQEAKRLLLAHQESAAQIAFKVGYLSPSQFSREYSRMFGLPPIQDIQQGR